MDIFHFFREWGMTAVFLRLFLAVFSGVVIGIEREARNKGAGVKTHALVCIGAALSMIIGEYALYTYPGTSVDVTRVGAQVISGIGFLGVGTIIVTGRNEVKGLTTAAGLWACAGIGLAAGIGFAEGALIALLFVILILRSLRFIDKKMRKESKFLDVYVEFDDNQGIKLFFKELRSQHINVLDFHLMKAKSGIDSPVATMTIELPRRGEKKAFISSMHDMPGVTFFEEI